MTKILTVFVLSLFFNNLSGQSSYNTPKSGNNGTKNNCPAGWDSCNATSIFSNCTIYYHPQAATALCINQFGIIIPKLTSSLSCKNISSKITIGFSFENFSGCLVFLKYKNFSIKSIQKSFNRFKSKYACTKAIVEVNVTDYMAFQKAYIIYVNTLSSTQKNILMNYIAFFENQVNY